MSESKPQRAAVDTELERFVEAVRASPEFQRFNEAREQLRADSEATELVEQFERKQTEFQQNEFDQEILAELGDLQEQMEDNETVAEFRDTREQLNDLLRETDTVVSEHLDQQFAQSSGGGCC